MDMAWMLIGFCFAAYAVVANDALQTLGTFLASNAKRPWWVLWLFAAGILTLALVSGWIHGDVSQGRLDRYPLPDPFSWMYILPPLALLMMTRWGLPVSTTFLVLTAFNEKNLYDMTVKSGLGYLLAFGLAIVLYLAITRSVEAHFLRTPERSQALRYVALQWAATGWLWYNWLVQDLANIYVFLPRDLSPGLFLLSVVVMLGLLAYTFRQSGGKIQRIVTSKINTGDIRSATLVDFSFGCVLFLFKEGWVTWLVLGEAQKIPMSTTWVFLGLLAGREIAMTWHLSPRPMNETLRMVSMDAGKALLGLGVSVALARLLAATL